MNAFRLPTGQLDRSYLRSCAVYKLLKQRRIGWFDAAIMLRRFWPDGVTPLRKHHEIERLLTIWRRNGEMKEIYG